LAIVSNRFEPNLQDPDLGQVQQGSADGCSPIQLPLNRRTDAPGHYCGIRLNDMGGNTMSDQAGLTSNEAKEFHSAYMQGFLGFTAIAVVAHILVWMWRPWF
jgi:light-harvesting complex 1 beta chain